MTKKILVVDDEQRIVRLVTQYLEQEGFQTVSAANGRQALHAARQEKPDLIILDLMMPEMSGQEFLKLHRQERDTPIIILTAKVEETDRVLGLELGADDYVTKPFSPRELTARIRAVLRRAGMTVPRAQVLRAADMTLDREAHTVFVGERRVDLTPSEFDLLAALMSAPGRVFNRNQLLDRVQGIRYEGYVRTIDAHVKNLRAKLESDARQPKYIETVYGVGYRFRAEA